jgi:Transposase IS66 family
MVEAVLQLLSIYLSGDFAEYWAFHVHCDQERLHPQGRWRPVQLVDEK